MRMHAPCMHHAYVLHQCLLSQNVPLTLNLTLTGRVPCLQITADLHCEEAPPDVVHQNGHVDRCEIAVRLSSDRCGGDSEYNRNMDGEERSHNTPRIQGGHT